MRKSLLLIALAAWPAMADAQPSSEWLAQGPLPGFGPRMTETQENVVVVRRVPAAETAERWTRMVAIHRMAGAAPADIWARTFADGLMRGCPGARYSAPARLQVDGRGAVDLRGDCPLNPATGQPETFLLRAISGTTALHVAQVLFRHVPSEAEIAWARTYLATVTLCSRDIATPACRALP